METGNPYAAPRASGADVDGAAASQPLASRGARFLARFLDGILETAPIVIGVIVAIAMTSGDQPALTPMLLGYLGALIIWIFQTVKLIQTGQTLGKRWAGVKVVRLDGSLASFGGHFLRGLVFGVLGIISVLFIFRDDHRCVHDMAGETKVIAV